MNDKKQMTEDDIRIAILDSMMQSIVRRDQLVAALNKPKKPSKKVKKGKKQ